MSTNNEATGTNFSDPTKGTLSEDFKSVVSDAAGLIKNTANQGGDVLATARSKVKDSLDMAKAKVADTQAAVVDQTKAAPKRRMCMFRRIPGNLSVSRQELDY